MPHEKHEDLKTETKINAIFHYNKKMTFTNTFLKVKIHVYCV